MVSRAGGNRSKLVEMKDYSKAAKMIRRQIWRKVDDLNLLSKVSIKVIH